MVKGAPKFDHLQLRELIATIFAAAGCEADEPRIISDHLVEANLCGHESHGVIRAAKYVQWLAAGMVVANRHAEVALDAGAILIVEGGFGFGQVIGLEAMRMGIKRVKESGVALVAIRKTGHLGRIGAFAEVAAEEGIVSLHFVNTTGFGILVAPFGGVDRRLSANPIAAGIPASGRAPIILDIATSMIAEGKIQVALNKGETLPEGAVLDGHGRPTRDPAAFYADPPGAILPFGGHKGSGLSVITEILAGSLTGGGSSSTANPTAGRLVNNMLTILIDPARFSSVGLFGEDVRRLVDWVTASPPVEADGRVRLPGDVERETRVERLANGIPLDNITVNQIREAAGQVGVAGALT